MGEASLLMLHPSREHQGPYSLQREEDTPKGFAGTFSGLSQHLSVIIAGKSMAMVSVQLLRHRNTFPLKSFHWKAEDGRWCILPTDTSPCFGGTALAEAVFCRLTLSVLQRYLYLCSKDVLAPKSPIHSLYQRGKPQISAKSAGAAGTYLLSCGDVNCCINSSRCPRNKTAAKKGETV